MLVASDRLTVESLTALFDGAALAVRIPGYLPGRLCDTLREIAEGHLAENSRHKIYRSDVPALTDTATTREEGELYLDTAADRLRHSRSVFFPYAWPADRVRCELDELWPGGARLLRKAGRPAYFGMVRLWEHGMFALPHIDVVGLVSPDIGAEFGFAHQIGVNIFLSGPQEGGDLEMWDLGPDDNGLSQTGYGYERDKLPEPDLVLHPRTGDLVLVRTNRLHAVSATATGCRLTVSGFVGCRSPEHELRLWS